MPEPEAISEQAMLQYKLQYWIDWQAA